MLSVNTIAQVVVNTSRASGSPSSFDTGLLLCRPTSFSDTKRFHTSDSVEDAVSFLTTTCGFAATDETVKAAQKYFAASPAPSRLLISCYPSTQTPSDALDTILDQTAAFYGVMLCVSETAANVMTFAAHVEALSQPLVLFVPITGTAASAVAADSLLDQLHTAQYKRSLPFYCAAISDCAAVMGVAMGLELSHPATAFALCYQTLNGITPSSLTQTQVDAIKALNGNVYVTRGYTHFLLENGTVASGLRYDEVLYLDKIADDLQNAAVSLLAENPDKMPQTDDSTAQFANRFSSILMGYTNQGVLASAPWRGTSIGPLTTGDVVENGFILWADSYDTQSDADRAAHKAVPIQVGLTLAGSIESIVITVNVQI